VVVPRPTTWRPRVLARCAGLPFEQLIDLCGVDYSLYRCRWLGRARYCVVSHLLSVSLNQRVRVKVFCPDDDFPVVDSVNRHLEFGQLV
jgi:NADH-quinone oxidoreductase subunit C